MKVAVVNSTEYQQFIDVVGLNRPEDIITVPARGKMVVEIPNETQFVTISKKNRGRLHLKKL